MPSKLKNKKTKEIGHIISFFSGVAKIQGLPRVFLHETLLDQKNRPIALVVGFDEQYVEALLFDENFNLDWPVFRGREKFSISINNNITGRVIDGLGRPLDNLGDLSGKKFSVFKNAPQIIERCPVEEPLTTGIKIIDSVLPLGRGQRELIIGDRKLGKSALALDTVVNQKNNDKPVHCIYVLCGQKEQKLKNIINLFKKNHSFLHTTIVAATARDSYASQYLAPFTGCAIGEYFRDRGEDALIVYDDLSKHAKSYRGIALLLERSPGRESYPGDIFSLHAGLLERAAKLSKEKKGGSLSALPIIETQEDDITSFIPTNLISITDGQIYLERGLFQKGFLPAVNVGLSVSRVGSQAQPSILKKVVGGIRLTLSQHKELQKLEKLETAVSEEAKSKIHRGQLTLEVLTQDKHTCVSWPEQAILFYAVENGFFDDLNEEEWPLFEKILLPLINKRHTKTITALKEGKFNKKIEDKIKKIVEDSKKEFLVKQ